MNIILSKLVALLLAVFAVLVLGLGLYTIHLKNQNNKLKKENRSYVEFNQVFQDSLKITKTKLNTEAVKVKVANMELSTIKKMSEDQRLEFIHQFESVNRKLKNLEAAAKVNATSRISIAAPLRDTLIVVHQDSASARHFHYKDKYNLVQGIVYSDSTSLSVITEVPLEGVVVTERDNWRLFGKERKWLPFGRKRLVAEFTSPNQNVRITDIKILVVN